MSNHIIIAAVSLLFMGSNVQRTPEKPVDKPVPTRFPGVFVKDSNGVPKPLHIQQLTANVHVRGTIATTTLEMVVYNPHMRVLEGEFSFPVADGQTVARFALDINGIMREAVVVDKTKGRETFEEVIRTKIDPALLEWTRDNSFRTRIYPINPKGTRRIIIAYEQQLARTDDGFGYTIPFAFPESIDTFSFHADVAAFGQRPSLAGDEGEKIDFTPHGRSFVADLYRENVVLDKPFMLTIPVVINNNVVSVNSFHGEEYVGIFLAYPPASAQRSLPSRISIVWDASLSRLKRDQKKEEAFLNEMFGTVKNVEVEFITFSNEVLKRSSHSVQNGDWSSLRRAITSIDYDGGTQLSSAPLKGNADITLLFSDGISTFGEHQLRLGKAPVYTVSSGAQADHAILRSIAERTGGAFIDLSARGMQDALSSLLEQKLMIRSISVVDGRMDEIRPVGAIEVQDVTTISGKLRSSSATLRIAMSMGNGEEHTETIVIDPTTQRDDGTSMARLWANFELQRLSADRARNAESIKALGMTFSIVTPGTSLIVLERIQDYVRFNIEPPASEPALVAQWKTLRASVRTDSLQAQKQHAEHVKSLVRLEKDRVETRRRAAIDTTRVAKAVMTRIARDNVADAVSLNSGIVAPGDNFDVRGSRTSESQVLVQGLTVTDQFVGGFGQALAPEEIGDDDRADRDGRISVAAPQSRSLWTEKLNRLSATETYAWYLANREKYFNEVSFYLDVADKLSAAKKTTEALRVLSCLSELHGEDSRTLRILAHRLMQIGYSKLAVMVFKDVKNVRDEEPQSWRDLGLALTASEQYQEAAEMFCYMIEHEWHSRFPEVELIAIHELNRLLKIAGGKIDRRKIDPTYITNAQYDVRVVLSWDADNCDMDLWVTDPDGELCMYNHRFTSSGGSLSRDLTGGYGPEEFILPMAKAGEYKVQVHYYGSRQQNVERPTTIQVMLFKNYNKSNEKHDAVTMRLDGAARVVDVGTIIVN